MEAAQMRRGGETCFVLRAAAAVFSYVLLMASTGARAQMRVGFYDSSCPAAEIIVQQEVSKAVSANPGLAAGLLRLHFHDCFVGGCEASVLIDSTSGNTAEKDAGPNKSLRGFEVIDRIKARVEQACFGVVSCADILAFAARDALALLTKIFASKGLNQKDLVTLSGAHTIGGSHCSSFSSRLQSPSPTAPDPTMDPGYVAQLGQQCAGASPGALVPMDVVTPNTFDEGFYKGVMANRGLLASDQALLSDGNTALQVVTYANDPATFQSDFAAAMVKMGYVGVLTGSSGKIRANCRVA
ncbi:peroxidase 5-like [Lolium rigidum]|uniref:peroxidase 5-like n=1 Tax=Lolium rigidum TaxID=89674 RepID=UPI001F5DF6F0|nr:peroxidase 5-like [Lolium rigidum]